MDDELEELGTGPEATPADIAEELCREAACHVRVPELDDVEDDHEESEWAKFLLDLDDADSGTVDAEDGQEVHDVGWIEDTRGGAVFVPYC